MGNVYENCPQFENEQYLMRFVSEDDCDDLLRVYSDEKAVPLFNSDNCNGDDFHYTTAKRMKQAIDFWHFSYNAGYFVRWSIIDKSSSEAVGSIELFHRDGNDAFTNCGLLRLDLRSDYENVDAITSILSLILPSVNEMFCCDIIATKVVPEAEERAIALRSAGFQPTAEKLIGHDYTEYCNYYVL